MTGEEGNGYRQIDTCTSISLSEELIDIFEGIYVLSSTPSPSGLVYLSTHEIVGFLPVRNNVENNF